MLKKNLLKVVAILILGIVTFTYMEKTVYADEMTFNSGYECLRYDDINDYRISFDIKSGKAVMRLKVFTESSVTINTEILLQRKSGSSWYTVREFEKTNTGLYQLHSVTASLKSQGEYRMKCIINAGDEEIIAYSVVKSY